MKDITVNGVMIDEYLRDNESIEEETKGREYIQNAKEKIYLNYHKRPKYKETKEKNGEVIVLGQIEKNQAEFKQVLLETIKKKDYRGALVIVIVAEAGKRLLTIGIAADYIYDFCKQEGIAISPTVRHSFRASIGYIKKSKFSNYLIINNRNTKENSSNTMKFKLDAEKAKDLSFSDAIKFSKELKSGIPNRKQKIEPVKTQPIIKPIESVKKPAMVTTDITSAILKALKDLSENNNSIVTVSGDLHIHINIQK